MPLPLTLRSADTRNSYPYPYSLHVLPFGTPHAYAVPASRQDTIRRALVNPGPDIVVCDEGHILKSNTSGISVALNEIKTLRRIVLTGTPLQAPTLTA